MSTAARLAAYGLALVMVAGGAWTVGAAVGPIADTVPGTHGEAEPGGGTEQHREGH